MRVSEEHEPRDFFTGGTGGRGAPSGKRWQRRTGALFLGMGRRRRRESLVEGAPLSRA